MEKAVSPLLIPPLEIDAAQEWEIVMKVFAVRRQVMYISGVFRSALFDTFQGTVVPRLIIVGPRNANLTMVPAMAAKLLKDFRRLTFRVFTTAKYHMARRFTPAQFPEL
jgi:hypothetical protein